MRRQFVPDTRVGINFMLVTFANFFLEDLFGTRHGTNGAQRANRTPLLSGLSQLYGATPKREQALRTLQVWPVESFARVRLHPKGTTVPCLRWAQHSALIVMENRMTFDCTKSIPMQQAHFP